MRTIFNRYSLIFASILIFSISKAQNVLYQETFETENKDWFYFDSPDLTTKVEDGMFKFTYKKSTVHASKFVTYSTDRNSSYSIETSVEHLKGIDNFGYGITFGAKDANNLYFFGISANGSFILYSYSNGKYTNLINWQSSIFIYRTVGFKNVLKVEKRDKKILLYINGQLVGSVDEPQFFGDRCGVLVQMNQTIGFDNFLIRSISKPTVNASAPPPADDNTGKIAYSTTFDKDDENNWVIPATDSTRTAIEGGYLKVFNRGNLSSTNTVTIPENWVDMDRDFLIESDIVHYSGIENRGYGITFGTDTKQAYHFYVANVGYFGFGVTSNTSRRELIPWTATTALRKGSDARNKITIIRKDGKISFFINDINVYKYADIGFSAHQFGVIVDGAQNVGFDYLTFKYLDNKESVNPNKQIAQVDNIAPQIKILAPETNRGLKVVSTNETIKVTGIATDASKIATVTINGISSILGTDGSFSADVPLKTGDNTLAIVATDEFKNQGTYTFTVVKNILQKAPEKEVANVLGKYYALVIGAENYADDNIVDLQYPVADATSLANTLKTTYTFDEQNINILKNPTRLQLFAALQKLINTVKPDDNVLIFYAGHGQWLEDRQEGFWIPTDATNGLRPSYVSNAELKEYISTIKSKHTLLITDACFAGSIFKTRSLSNDAPKAISVAYDLPSRKVMTSGALKEVPDKSVFVEYLLKRLNQNTEKYLAAEDLFYKLKTAVINNSNDQTPLYGEIRSAGDEGGDFIFIKR